MTFKDLIQNKPGPVWTQPGIPWHRHGDEKEAQRGSHQSPRKQLRGLQGPNGMGADISPAAITAERCSRGLPYGPGTHLRPEGGRQLILTAFPWKSRQHMLRASKGEAEQEGPSGLGGTTKGQRPSPAHIWPVQGALRPCLAELKGAQGHWLRLS